LAKTATGPNTDKTDFDDYIQLCEGSTMGDGRKKRAKMSSVMFGEEKTGDQDVSVSLLNAREHDGSASIRRREYFFPLKEKGGRERSKLQQSKPEAKR